MSEALDFVKQNAEGKDLSVLPGSIKSMLIQKYYPTIFNKECTLFLEMIKNTMNYTDWINFNIGHI